MSETKWTPGPWKRVDTPDYAEIHAPGAKQPVALVGTPEDADAVASLPDLYDAAHNMRQLLHALTSADDEFANAVLAAADAALSRARGDAQ